MNDRLKEMHDRYGARLRSRIRWMMGPQARRIADSVDFLNDVFVEICRDPDPVPSDDEGVLRWMCAVARNRIRSDVRRKRERALDSLAASVDGAILPEAPGSSPASIATQRERVDRLMHAIEQLEPDRRRVIELRDLEELPFREIGRRMERTEDAVQKLHTRAVLQLGRLLDGS